MAARYPIQYQVTPTSINPGLHWLTVNLKNIGDSSLTGLHARLIPLDTYDLDVQGKGRYVPALHPNEKEELHFQVSARATGGTYITLDGRQEGEPFHWESPPRRIVVGSEVAEMVSLFAMTEPYPRLGEPITVEATVRGLTHSEGLILEFWAETPSGESISLDKTATAPLPPGEVDRYKAELTPEEQGIYELHAYLFDDTRRIGHQVEYVTLSK